MRRHGWWTSTSDESAGLLGDASVWPPRSGSQGLSLGESLMQELHLASVRKAALAAYVPQFSPRGLLWHELVFFCLLFRLEL